MHPPTVAGWSQGRSWITPSLLFERGNFVLDVVSPDLNFVPPDRFPTFTPEVARVQKRLRSGMSIKCHHAYWHDGHNDGSVQCAGGSR